LGYESKPITQQPVIIITGIKTFPSEFTEEVEEP